MSSKQYSCWICSSDECSIVRESTLTEEITSDNFRITDVNYGQTFRLYQCSECGFLFCPEVNNLTSYYEDMEDSGYEQTRNERSLQARALIKTIKKYRSYGSLLDIGAGSGVFVEQAQKEGYDALGIEPCNYLYNEGIKRGIPLIRGVLPSREISEKYDVITLIDVIEHVSTPKTLLEQAHELLADNGICIVVTPDIDSFMARIMGRRWWHFRIAHVGYFSRKTLDVIARRAGLQIVSQSKPGWYFPASYLMRRALSYIPYLSDINPPALLDRIVVPLNLKDSIMIICKKRNTPS